MFRSIANGLKGLWTRRSSIEIARRSSIDSTQPLQLSSSNTQTDVPSTSPQTLSSANNSSPTQVSLRQSSTASSFSRLGVRIPSISESEKHADNMTGLQSRRSSMQNSQIISSSRRASLDSNQRFPSPLSNTRSEVSGTPPVTPSSINSTSSQLSSSDQQSTNKDSDNQRQLLAEENFVRVRIWTSKTRNGQDTFSANAIILMGNVGHATLETNNIYASIWPDWNNKVGIISAESDFSSTLKEDKRSEARRNETEREPEYLFEFYSLDVKRIEDFFEKVKQDKAPWTLFGNAPEHKGYSCSGLTMRLLEEGGLSNLASRKIRSIVSPTSTVIFSPNNLINQLTLAKALEESKYPETLDFKSSLTPEGALNKKESFLLTVKIDKVNILNNSNSQVIKTTEAERSEYSNVVRRKP